MPRKARIDAPGALHHIIGRGIERCDIFRDAVDCESFLSRLGQLLTASSTACLGWALMGNHTHLLLRTGLVPILPQGSAEPVGLRGQQAHAARPHG
jgi:REP element-mobilizing transposase RayT